MLKFLQSLLGGLVSGLVLAAALLYVLQGIGLVEVHWGQAPVVASMLAWLDENFGSSLFVFAALLLGFCHQLSALVKALGRDENAHIALLEQRLELLITLFFGTGVIYTAIGMRGALLYALGGEGSLADSAADEVLSDLVNGGILVALSTTILGGLGGYLMRVVRVWATGPALIKHRQEQQNRFARVLAHELKEALSEPSQEPRELSP